MDPLRPRRTSVITALACAVLTLAASCGPSAAASTSDVGALTLRLGYFPNLTHAAVLVGIRNGSFAAALGPDVKLEAHTFNAGPDVVTAILSGSVDAAFMGPNPTTNAYVQSHGRAVRVVAGATSGGSLLVVRSGIKSVADLRGKRIADPQLGGTQDVALRWFLKGQRLRTDTAGGGDVHVLPQNNAQTLAAFRQGEIDGAWVPEPWASRLIIEGGARVLVDERDLWPHGLFVTTNLVVSTNFLRDHPKRVKALIEGLYESVLYMESNRLEAQRLASDALAEISKQNLAPGVIPIAWSHMTFTLDPLAVTLAASADHAHDLGLLAQVNLKSLYALAPLNDVLQEHQQPMVSAL
jgi:sulfonate transport system substrate-binding protein